MRAILAALTLAAATFPVLAAVAPSPAHSEARTVRVGSNMTGRSGNPPLIFSDESGRPVGIFVDIIQHVAAGQGWKLEWVPCIWAACPAMLAGGEIDLISALAYSDERARKFDFTLETVFSNWAVVLRAPGNEIHSITDLEGLRVATNRGTPSYKRVLLRYNEGRKWRYAGNWKCNGVLGYDRKIYDCHFNLLTPFFRFTKCNGQIEIGLGNHFIELGW